MRSSRLALAVLATLQIVLMHPASLRGQGAPITGTAMVNLAPPATSVNVGAMITVQVRVDLSSVTGRTSGGAATPAVLGGYQIRVTFDSSRLRLTDAGAGTSTGYTSTPTSTNLDQANAGGAVTITAVQTNPNAPVGLVHVVTLTFSAQQAGNVTLTGTPVSLSSAAQSGGAGPTAIPGTAGSATVTVQQLPGTPLNPNPPNGANNVAPGQVPLSWTATNATSFQLYFGTITSPPLVATTTGPSFTATTQPGTFYYWRVVAVNAAGSVQGPTWSFRTSGTAPCTPPAGVPALDAPSEAQSGQAYQITWTAVADANEYVIDEATTSDFTGGTSTTIPAGGTASSFTHTVTADTSYFYRVRAKKNASGCVAEGSNSATASVLVRAVAAPPPPLPPPLKIRVIPAVGSLQGALGAFFRTAVQLHNASLSSMSGRLRFHRAGVPGSAGDPSIEYTLAPRQTVSYPDLVATMEQQGSLGSLDLETTGEIPIVVTRVYNDAGERGTTGMNEELIDPASALQTGDQAVLVAPLDPAAFRLNIGVRSFGAGATITFRVVSDRAEVKTLTKSYAANFFTQSSASDFLERAVAANETIEIRVDAGSAFVYGAITDNKTQDPAMQVARRLTSSGSSSAARVQK